MDGFKILITLVLIWITVFYSEANNVTTESFGTETPKPASVQSYKPGNITAEKCKEYEESSCKGLGGIFVHNGRPVLRNEFPHMAAIGFNASEGKIVWLCGGGLISERFVLTAAHCCYSPTWKNATVVRLGDRNLQNEDDDEFAENHAIIERIKHPNYTSNSYYHDIALLKLEGEVRFNRFSEIGPICLLLPHNEIPDYAKTAGWGKINWNDNNGSAILMAVTLTLANNSHCNKVYADETDTMSQGIVSDWQICAGGDSKDTCPGDSGGLLFTCDICSRLCTAIGVTSVGKICEGSVPGVYTRVSHYVPWIEEIVWP